MTSRDEIIYGNKFCNEFIDNNDVVFFHTSKINFNEIVSRDDESVVLITHNSDDCITDHHANLMPRSVKKWFCQNKMTDHPKFEIIPLGIENPYEALKSGHGVGYEKSIERLNLLSSSRYENIKEENLIYANFRLWTNPHHRTAVKKICVSHPHISFDEPNLSYDEFLKRISSHQAVLCPQGNGHGDNHRFWESIYCGRIPFTFNKNMYNSLYKYFPSVLVESYEQLCNEEWIRAQIDEVKSKKYDPKYSKFSYWKSLIERHL